MSLYMAEAELLAELKLAVWQVLVLVHVRQEVWLQGRWEWMRKIGVDHNTVHSNGIHSGSNALFSIVPHLWQLCY